ncbi:MAG: prephenate dehydratase [Acidimicrobiales bacterium]|nr:prephenate dehydratase [Acidimicrobiales bacterium]
MNETARSSPNQQTLRVGYLGPAGTFTEQALLTQTDLASAELVMFRRIPQVLAAVADGSIDRGFVAIENAIEGTVNVTVDALAFDLDVLIQREVDMRIEMCLQAPAGTELADLTRVISIPVASAQCSRFLAEQLPDAEVEAAHSTAAAAEVVAKEADGRSAAIGPARSAEVYGLEILASGIEDHPENHTRFVTVARDGIPAPTGHDKTSLVIYQKANEPGSLMSILQEFAARGINLSNLQSRPTKHRLGDYCFIVELEGHITDRVVADCLRNLHMKQGGIKFLGSYPATGVGQEEIRQDVSERGESADAWLADLRSRVVD